MTSRVLHGLANLGRLPETLAKISVVTQTTLIATAAALGSALAIPIGEFAGGISRSTLTIFIIACMSPVPIWIPIFDLLPGASLLAFGG